MVGVDVTRLRVGSYSIMGFTSRMLQLSSRNAASIELGHYKADVV